MRAAVNGIELEYHVDGSGPACFVIHGGLGLDHQSYRRTLQPLAESLQLIFFDVRGNGVSGRLPMPDLTIEAMGDDVAALADHLGLDQFLVLGHSWGGFIAQETVLRHPDRVLGTMLIGTRPGQLGVNESADEHPIPPRPDALLALPAPTDDASSRVFWEAAVPYFTNPDSVPALRAALEGTVYCNDALLRSDEIYDSWSTIDRLSSIQSPVLVLVGSEDLICSPADSARIADRLPNGTFVTLPGSNHFPWIEAPDSFFAAVTSWLAANALA